MLTTYNVIFALKGILVQNIDEDATVLKTWHIILATKNITYKRSGPSLIQCKKSISSKSLETGGVEERFYVETLFGL